MQVLRAHGTVAAPGAQPAAALNDPRTLVSMYREPPDEEVGILDLEEMALARLRGAPADVPATRRSSCHDLSRACENTRHADPRRHYFNVIVHEHA